MFFTSSCFLLVTLLFKVAPMHSSELLSIVSKHKALMCLTEKISLLNNYCSDINYSAVYYEFNVNESQLLLNKAY